MVLVTLLKNSRKYVIGQDAPSIGSSSLFVPFRQSSEFDPFRAQKENKTDS